MEIDRDRVLCLVATDHEKYPNRAEFYRVDGVLSLQNYDGDETLTGHPAKDLDLLPPRDDGAEWSVAHKVPVSTIRKIQNWTQLGHFVAYGVGGCNMHRKRQEKLLLSFAKPKDYLTPEQQFWLKSYCDTSFIFSEERDNRIAWARVFNGIAEIAKAVDSKPKLMKKAKPNKERLKRKEQRRQQLAERYGSA